MKSVNYNVIEMVKNGNKSKSKNSKNIIYIADSYESFTKDQIEVLSPNFKKINVFIGYNKINDLSAVLPLRILKERGRSRIDLNSLPKNINVIPTPFFSLPTNNSFKNAGPRHMAIVKRVLSERKINFDMVHSHFIWSPGYVGSQLKKQHNIPFIVTAHGYDIYDLPFRDEDWREKITSVLNSADRIITVSNKNYDCIRKLKIKTKVEIIPNGYRSNMFFPKNVGSCRKELGLPKNKKIILTIGNLIPIKGHEYLISSMSKIVKKNKNILCLILGSGNLVNKLERKIRSMDLREHVKIIDQKPHSEIPTWINASDVFVLPSLNEGNPTVMFEALGCGKPFVGTIVGGVPEIIVDDKLGLLVAPKKFEELTTAIIESLDKKWDSEYIYDYSKKFTWETICNRIKNVYNEVLLKY